MPQDLDFSNNLFGVVDISKYVINKLDGYNLSGVYVLCFDNLTETSLTEILHEFVVASHIVPFCSKNEVALLLLGGLFHYNNYRIMFTYQFLLKEI